MLCPHCGTENPSDAAVCGTCVNVLGSDELTGATHRQHLSATASNPRLWRVASAGPGYIVVAALSRGIAEAMGAELLRDGAQDDQTVIVTEVSQQGKLVYVRSALTPYPSTRKPWQVERDRRIAAHKRTRAVPVRAPVPGRPYIGRVATWDAEVRHGTIAFADRAISNVAVSESGVLPRDLAGLRAGRNVTFEVEETQDGFVAIKVSLLGLPPPEPPHDPADPAESAPVVSVEVSVVVALASPAARWP